MAKNFIAPQKITLRFPDKSFSFQLKQLIGCPTYSDIVGNDNHIRCKWWLKEMADGERIKVNQLIEKYKDYIVEYSPTYKEKDSDQTSVVIRFLVVPDLIN